MKRLASFLFVLVFFASCADKTPQTPKPADLIPRDKMIQLMADIHLLEGALSVSNNPGPEKRELAYYNVFTKNGVTHQQYESSINWYSQQLEDFGKMYEEVQNELSRRQAREQAGQKAPEEIKNPALQNDPTGGTKKPGK